METGTRQTWNSTQWVFAAAAVHPVYIGGVLHFVFLEAKGQRVQANLAVFSNLYNTL